MYRVQVIPLSGQADGPGIGSLSCYHFKPAKWSKVKSYFVEAERNATQQTLCDQHTHRRANSHHETLYIAIGHGVPESERCGGLETGSL